MISQLLLPAPSGTELPKVSIHLPICNEPPQTVRETLDALAALDYDRFEVLVVDSNTADPHLWEPVAEHCARLGPKFRFFTLGHYKGLKAGALNFALCETAPDAEIIGVVDSDQIVARHWLRAMVPAFADPKLGFAQSKREGAMMLIRKQALSAVQGWAEWCVAEDAELALRLFRAGYEANYERSFGQSAMPDDFSGLRAQRAQEAYGAMRILRAHAGALLNPFNRQLTRGQRWHFAAGWLPLMGDALGLVFLLMALAWSAGLILDPMREVPVALVLPVFGLFLFKLAPLFEGRTDAALAGLALSHVIGKAVWRGLFTSQPPLSRTPAPARKELWILLLIWSALLGVGISQDWATLAVRLWCTMLFIQSLPYLAAVVWAVSATMPIAQRKKSFCAAFFKKRLLASLPGEKTSPRRAGSRI